MKDVKEYIKVGNWIKGNSKVPLLCVCNKPRVSELYIEDDVVDVIREDGTDGIIYVKDIIEVTAKNSIVWRKTVINLSKEQIKIIKQFKAMGFAMITIYSNGSLEVSIPQISYYVALKALPIFRDVKLNIMDTQHFEINKFIKIAQSNLPKEVVTKKKGVPDAKEKRRNTNKS